MGTPRLDQLAHSFGLFFKLTSTLFIDSIQPHEFLFLYFELRVITNQGDPPGVYLEWFKFIYIFGLKCELNKSSKPNNFFLKLYKYIYFQNYKLHILILTKIQFNLVTSYSFNLVTQLSTLFNLISLSIFVKQVTVKCPKMTTFYI